MWLCKLCKQSHFAGKISNSKSKFVIVVDQPNDFTHFVKYVRLYIREWMHIDSQYAFIWVKSFQSPLHFRVPQKLYPLNSAVLLFSLVFLARSFVFSCSFVRLNWTFTQVNEFYALLNLRCTYKLAIGRTKRCWCEHCWIFHWFPFGLTVAGSTCCNEPWSDSRMKVSVCVCACVWADRTIWKYLYIFQGIRFSPTAMTITSRRSNYWLPLFWCLSNSDGVHFSHYWTHQNSSCR